MGRHGNGAVSRYEGNGNHTHGDYEMAHEYRTTFLNENHIVYQYSRKKHGRQISLAKRAGDSGDGGDSDIGIPPVTVIDA